MNIRLERYSSGVEDTLGKIYINGSLVCYTLEDQHRDTKVMGDTRIPAGTYKVELRKEGTHHLKYLQRFGTEFHKGMLHLQDVPNFKYILIHIGNTDADTMGCILLGTLPSGKSPKKKRAVLHSTVAYQVFYPPVAEALLKGEEVTIEIINKG